MNYKYIAWNTNDTYEFFKTEEEAKKWCEEAIENERVYASDEGWDESANIGYAKIIAEGVFKEVDSIKNYPCLKDHKFAYECDTCDEACEGAEEWPYSDQFDRILELNLQKVQG